MFEKEAEEKYCKGCKSRMEQCLWAWRNTNGLNEVKNCSCKEVPNYIRGAEFDYNKAFVEADKNLKAVIADFNKANEWHYVKDVLPKTSGRYLVYTGGEPFILDFDTEVNSFGYGVVSFGDDWSVQYEDFETVKDRGEDEVIAWKEIVLPKEIKEK